jgi:hypothetical protein
MKSALIAIFVSLLISQSLMASSEYAPLCRELKRESLELRKVQSSLSERIKLQEDLLKYYKENYVGEKAFALNTAVQVAAWWSLFRLAYKPAQIVEGGLAAGGSMATAALFPGERILFVIFLPFIPIIASEAATIMIAEKILTEDIPKQATFGVLNAELISKIKIYQTDYLMSDLLEKHSLFKSWIKNSNEKNNLP